MSNEIKTALKEARELIKQNEHAEAVKRCKKILKKDKSNYAALVLLAAAMREIDEFKSQAPLALEKAIEIQSDNPVAWQGLVAYYEKEPENEITWSKLLLAYCKLLQLDSSSSKVTQFLSKISDLALRLKNEGALSQAIQMLSQLRETSKDKHLIDKTLAWILTQHSSNMDDHQELLESVLAIVAKDNDVVNRQEYYRKYLNVLNKLGKLKNLIDEAVEMHKQFAEDTYPLECICRVYYEHNLLDEHHIDIDITQFSEALLNLDPESEVGIMAKAVYLKITGNIVKSRECLNQIILSKTKSFYAWMLLSEVNMQLYCWEDAENAANEALKYMKSDMKDKLQHKIELIQIEAMSRSNNRKKWELAAQMCKKFLEKESSVQLQLIHARTSVFLNDAEVLNELNHLELQEQTKIQAVLLKALILKNQKQLVEAANVLDSAVKDSETWQLLGKIYWEMGDYNPSLVAFLNGIQADRHNWECLLYIGHYYRLYGNDVDRARRCYQTALQINPGSEEAGIGLSTSYRLLKNKNANMQLLQRITMQGSGPKWAWLQLGLQYLDQEDAEKAIRALQHVIRADPNDNHSWESLADAYLIRGAHTSALKSYQRALELCPGSLYPMIQLANVKLVIGQLEDAKEDFEHILQSEPHNIYALKGLAETYLGLARENISNQLLGRAATNLQQAADSLTNIILKRADLSCIWKLLGDVCYRIATMSDKYCYLNVASILIEKDAKEGETRIIRKTDIVSLCARCYRYALRISQDSALLWHDLACCYLMQLKLVPTEERKDVAVKCLAAAKHAIKLCPTSWFHWNVLGVICMSPEIKNYALAQHCFVMAIDRELNNAVVWSNLGTLYLHLGDPYRANEAFGRAQRADPSYVNSWIGQGLIAEQMCRKEAIDLFRHATQLGYHSQAALGYAHWVLTVLLNPEIMRDPLYIYIVENMHAVSVASDVLNWYIEHDSNNAYAYNAYGLLLERQRLYASAAKQFTKALTMDDDENKDNIYTNLARVLIQLGRYNEAIQLCRNVKKANFNAQCHLALSYFKAEKYEESYDAYETALQWLANTDTEKANVLCAMAAMAYIFQGVDDVKTLLFQCIQIQPPTIAGFLAAASLGILHANLNLTTLVLKELKPYQDHLEYGHHVANLSAYSYLIQGDVKGAIRILSKAIHRRPSDVRCWIRLIRILLERDLETFGRCVQKALYLSRSISVSNVVQIVCASSLSHLTRDDLETGIRSAQKAVFTYPGNVESWSTFIFALLLRSTDSNLKSRRQWILSLISAVQNFRSTQQMAQWLHSNKNKIDYERSSTCNFIK